MRWNPTVHAIQRLKERFDVKPEGALNYVNQVMAQAKYVSAGKAGKLVYYYEKRDMMIVVNPDENVIVTVHPATEPAVTPAVVPAAPAPSAAPKLTIDRIADAVKREYKRMRTEVAREINKMKEEHAATGVKIAELRWKYVRCKAPHTKALIQSRIDELVAVTRQITTDIDAKLTQMEAAEAEVRMVVGE